MNLLEKIANCLNGFQVKYTKQNTRLTSAVEEKETWKRCNKLSLCRNHHHHGKLVLQSIKYSHLKTLSKGFQRLCTPVWKNRNTEERQRKHFIPAGLVSETVHKGEASASASVSLDVPFLHSRDDYRKTFSPFNNTSFQRLSIHFI